MAAYVSILRKLISWSFYNRALPKSNLKSGSAPDLRKRKYCKNVLNSTLESQKYIITEKKFCLWNIG